MSDSAPAVQLLQLHDYQFQLDFNGAGTPLLVDEPAPLGQGAGPSPEQLLASAVASCLSASLLFALRKYKQQPEPIGCTMQVQVGRNAEGRNRVLGMQARLRLGVPAAALVHLDRVLASFENFCTVTQSVRAAIPVEVQVFDSLDVRLN